MALSPLTISDDKLSFLVDGAPFIWRGTLDWPLYGRYLNEGAETVREVLRDRKSVGANTVCCGAMLSWWPDLNPTNPAWWDKWRDFAELCHQEELRLSIVVFCDTATYPVDPLPHWERFYVQLGDQPHVTLVGVNQPGHPSQRRDLDPRLLETKPVSNFPRLLFARDNPFESANPIVPPGDFALYCCSRDTSKYAEIGSSMHYVVEGWGPGESWQGSRVVSVLWEPWHGKPYGVTSDAGLWRQIARSLCFRGTGGGNFYSDQCSRAALLTGRERDDAVEFLGNIP